MWVIDDENATAEKGGCPRLKVGNKAMKNVEKQMQL